MPEKTESRIALFVDFENLVTNTGLTAANFDLQPELDRLLERGKVVFRRAYCDWSRFREAKGTLHELGFELVDVPPSTRAGKNGADMRLVIDALELCYAREHIDTFAIASGDSDFCPLAYKLRENDRTVIGLAVRSATSPFFVKACDQFIYVKTPTRAAASDIPDSSERERTSSRQRGGRDPSKKRIEPVVPTIAREVVSSLLAKATGPLNPSLIKQTIVRKEPDFDERDLGFSTFSKLLAQMERDGLLRLQQLGRQWYVLLPDVKNGEPSDEVVVRDSTSADDR
ncbi:MAG TPA: NYN domain-containing protein [Myxococcaceae bacterium]|nr:NYN domain-containing protein [Myxococcaceae bacterium]